MDLMEVGDSDAVARNARAVRAVCRPRSLRERGWRVVGLSAGDRSLPDDIFPRELRRSFISNPQRTLPLINNRHSTTLFC